MTRYTGMSAPRVEHHLLPVSLPGSKCYNLVLSKHSPEMSVQLEMIEGRTYYCKPESWPHPTIKVRLAGDSQWVGLRKSYYFSNDFPFHNYIFSSR